MRPPEPPTSVTASGKPALIPYLSRRELDMQLWSKLWAEDEGPEVVIRGPCPENCHRVLPVGGTLQWVRVVVLK